MDKFGWTCGYLCDCGYFEFRKTMPKYDDRLKEHYRVKK